MAGEYILDLETVKKITKAKDDAQAAAQIEAAQELMEAYLNITFIKRDIADEAVTLPYKKISIVSPQYAPINSVKEIKVLQSDGSYQAAADIKYSIGKETVQILSGSLFAPGVMPRPAGQIAALKISYNAGLYDDYTQAPALLKSAAQGLLGWLFADPDAMGGYSSEHLSDYSYTKAALVNGLPEGIAAILNKVRL